MIHNAKYVIPGIIVFVAAVTFPFWFNLASPAYVRPALALPADQKECVETVEFMRAEHMQLLSDWRDKALREGLRSYTSSNGTVWEISLQNTCMSCHTDREKFCDACHTSNSVAPYCWDCHIEPENRAKGTE